jgi:hypothetical protein
MKRSNQPQLWHRAWRYRHAGEKLGDHATSVDVIGRGAHYPRIKRRAPRPRERSGMATQPFRKRDVAAVPITTALEWITKGLAHRGQSLSRPVPPGFHTPGRQN